MYAFISGTVVAVSDGKIVLENNGIGYELTVSSNTIFECGTIGRKLQLFTYLHVKEDAMSLFGFFSSEEKEMFLKLITISGVGPKLSMQVLSGCDLKTLAICIATGDVKTLSKVKGLGKKTAERIILELREKVDAKDIADVLKSEQGLSTEIKLAAGQDISDAVYALISLGISKTDAVKAVTEAAMLTDKIDEIIAFALKNV